MPELPEVENVVVSLRKILVGQKVTRSTLLRPRLAPSTTPRTFAVKLRDTQVLSVARRGKHILIGFDNGATLIVHLRMTGRFLLLSPETEDPNFTHAVFFLDNDERLVFRDQRHFGMMRIASSARIDEAKELKKLAPEPFSDEFSSDYLKALLASSKRSIKEFLLDQTKVCGLGNIYASEVLFRARIEPRKKCCDLSKTKAGSLRDLIRDVLAEAIEAVRKSKAHPEYIGESGYDSGDYEKWEVYGRAGEKCPRCGKGRIARIVQAGRSTFFCPRCQR